MTAQVSSADHEAEEGYFSLGDTATVVAKPDEKWGETPCAFIELRAGKSATAEEIITWCRAGMAHYKVPRHVVFVELPKTSTGKIQKFKLREQFWEGQERQVH